tara:strand:+ start:2064 stop:2651 length:588 start_codon:yes stop_codon:yes gene_type:complete
LGYIFGCIQTSYFIGKFKFQVDVKSQGSKNAGASNGVMLFGWKYGIFIGLVDIFKAYIPTVFILSIYPNNIFLASLAGGGAILGHIYPFFMGFNGGKGMSSYFGMLLGLNPLFGLYTLVAASILLITTNYVALATILILLFSPIMIHFMYDSNIYDFNLVMCISFFSILIFLKHTENLKKIYQGTEKTFWSVFKK